MKKIIISLQGGLGNQLFQYATGKAIALKNNANLLLDTSEFSKKLDGLTPRKYALTPFNLNVIVQQHDFGDQHITGFLGKVLRKIKKIFFFQRDGAILYHEKSSDFDAAMTTISPPAWLIGYWQSEKYFDNAANIIRQEIGTPVSLSKKSQAMLMEITSRNAVCIHIRRGDYITNPTANSFHGTCDLEYYYKGLSLITKQETDAHAFIFSDEPVWVRSNFNSPIPATVVDINTPEDAHEDLWLMAACKHYIIANSSFSWWGAWLGSYSKKIVIAPKQWYKNSHTSTKDLIPDSWIRL